MNIAHNKSDSAVIQKGDKEVKPTSYVLQSSSDLKHN